MYSLEAKIAELKRELAMRERLYPQWIASGKADKDESEKRIGILKEILQDYIAQLPTKQTSLFNQ